MSKTPQQMEHYSICLKGEFLPCLVESYTENKHSLCSITNWFYITSIAIETGWIAVVGESLIKCVQLGLLSTSGGVGGEDDGGGAGGRNFCSSLYISRDSCDQGLLCNVE